MLSLLAKVQVLPLFVLLSLGLAGWIYGWNLSALKQLVKNTCRATVLSAALLAAFKIVGIDVGANFIASLSVLALAATPFVHSSHCWHRRFGLFHQRRKINYFDIWRRVLRLCSYCPCLPLATHKLESVFSG